MQQIDNTDLLNDAHRVIGIGTDLVKRLERDVQVNTPEKEKTLWAINFVIETQSEAIRRLVEHILQINDQLNLLIDKHSL